MEEQGQQFEGWAIVEIMGHQKVSGYVTTVAYGSVVMFKVLQTAVDPVEEVLTERGWFGGHGYLEAGSVIRRSRKQAETQVGANSIYRLTRCTEQQANESQPVDVEVVHKAGVKAIEAPDAQTPPTKANVEQLYTALQDDPHGDYDSGVRDALGWLLGKEPRPMCDSDPDSDSGEENPTLDEENDSAF